MLTSTNRNRSKDQQEASLATVVLIVRQLSEELHPHDRRARTIGLDTSLDKDLGFDSLGRVELLARIERAFDVTLQEEVFATAETPRDLLRAIVSASGSTAPLPPTEILAQELGEAEIAPRSAKTLVEVLLWHVEMHPNRPHIRIRDRHGQEEALTYGELKEGAAKVAAGLQRYGVRPRESITLMLPTSREYFFSFFGILMAGAIPVPIYPPARPSQIEDHLRRQVAILENCRAVVMITVRQAVKLARVVKAQVDSLREIVTAEQLVAHGGGYATTVISAEDIALLQYTSGSTGNPKGVILTHANLMANIRADGDAIQAGPEDIFVSWLPLYHDMGLIGAWLGSLYFATQLVIMSPLTFITRPQTWLWAVHQHRGTLSAAPNFAYELCVNRIKDAEIKGLDLSSWRVSFNAAEAVNAETVRRFNERFRRYGLDRKAIHPAYGLAECSVGLSFPRLGRGLLVDRVVRSTFMHEGRAVPAEAADTSSLAFVCCGLPLPEHEIRIVDPQGRELPERHEGRLEFRGPSATSGYFRNPEATGRLFHDGWLDSGDLAYIAGGEVFITGRAKDIIIRAGRNIYPEELEAAIGDLAGIRKGCVAVFGTTDSKTGTERLVVLAEKREREPVNLEALNAQINTLSTDLAEAPPDDIVLAPPRTVLKTSSGKIRRAACKELYEKGRLGASQRAVWWQMARLVLSSVVPQLRRMRQAAASWLFAAYAWTLFGMLAIPAWFTVLVLPGVRLRWRVLRALLYIGMRAAGIRISLRGSEHLSSSGPSVFVANHSSYLDAFVFTAALPIGYSFVAKSELDEQFFAGLLLRRLGTEFVARDDVQRSAEHAKHLTRKIQAGRRLILFPEGTFTRAPGLRAFHMGAFLAAAEAGVPVVPIAIRGTRSILRSDSWFPRRGGVTITVCEPLPPAKAHDAEDSWEVAVALRDSARDCILRHCGEVDLENHSDAGDVEVRLPHA